MYILVTGGAGFIGSNFIKYMLSKYKDYQIINLDLLTYAGDLRNLSDVQDSERYIFIKGDICDKALLEEIYRSYDIKSVVHFAAETHVDRSIADPEIFLKTNVLGTQSLLDISKKYWSMDKSNPYNTSYTSNVRFVQISTDEVYGTLENSGFFTEYTPLAPNSPYSASKASADFIVRAYYETYKLPILITRCSNNYGPNQDKEKFIPLMIDQACKEQKLTLYGDGQQVRDWLHVEDHCRAIDVVLHRGQVGEVYNVGGNNERKNIEIAKFILTNLNKDINQLQFVRDRLGHDQRYAIDSSKIFKTLGWVPENTLDQGLIQTIEWYARNEKIK